MDKQTERKIIGHCSVCHTEIKQGEKMYEGRVTTDNTGTVRTHNIPLYCELHVPEGVV